MCSLNWSAKFLNLNFESLCNIWILLVHWHLLYLMGWTVAMYCFAIGLNFGLNVGYFCSELGSRLCLLLSYEQ